MRTTEGGRDLLPSTDKHYTGDRQHHYSQGDFDGQEEGCQEKGGDEATSEGASDEEADCPEAHEEEGQGIEGGHKKKAAPKKKTLAKKKAVVIKKAAKRAAVKKKAVTKPKTTRTIAARMSSLATMTSPVTPPEPPRPDAIKHVVVLMFENHSFDQMLGCFHSAGAEGVDPARPRSNKDSTGDEYFQRESSDPVVSPDPKHELEHILHQLKDDNSGFVSEYEKEYAGKNPDLQRIMDYFGMGDLPALHELARHFTICDHWFSSVPGPTWTNRFFVHSGTSLGRVKMPGGMIPNPLLYAGYVQDTIYDRLNEKGIPWTIYHGDVPQSLVLSHQQRGSNLLRYEWLDRFAKDAGGPEPNFPAYVFIEPNYFHIPFEQPQNDDHPPHSTIPRRRFSARFTTPCGTTPTSGTLPCWSCSTTNMAGSTTMLSRLRLFRQTIIEAKASTSSNSVFESPRSSFRPGSERACSRPSSTIQACSSI